MLRDIEKISQKYITPRDSTDSSYDKGLLGIPSQYTPRYILGLYTGGHFKMLINELKDEYAMAMAIAFLLDRIDEPEYNKFICYATKFMSYSRCLTYLIRLDNIKDKNFKIALLERMLKITRVEQTQK